MGLLSPPPESVELIVARLVSTSPPRIDIAELPDIIIREGQPLLLKALYRIEDLPELEESTHIEFTSEVDGQGPKPSVLHRRDRPILDDTIMGYLAQRHQLPLGDHVVRFIIHLERDAHPWNHAGSEHRHLTAEGAVGIHVMEE